MRRHIGRTVSSLGLLAASSIGLSSGLVTKDLGDVPEIDLRTPQAGKSMVYPHGNTGILGFNPPATNMNENYFWTLVDVATGEAVYSGRADLRNRMLWGQWDNKELYEISGSGEYTAYFSRGDILGTRTYPVSKPVEFEILELQIQYGGEGKFDPALTIYGIVPR